jgi:hypothetical protein
MAAASGRVQGPVACAALGAALHLGGGLAALALPQDMIPKFIHENAFNIRDGAIVGFFCRCA